MYRCVNMGRRYVITKNNVLVLDSELKQVNSLNEGDAKALCKKLNGENNA